MYGRGGDGHAGINIIQGVLEWVTSGCEAAGDWIAPVGGMMNFRGVHLAMMVVFVLVQVPLVAMGVAVAERDSGAVATCRADVLSTTGRGPGQGV